MNAPALGRGLRRDAHESADRWAAGVFRRLDWWRRTVPGRFQALQLDRERDGRPALRVGIAVVLAVLDNLAAYWATAVTPLDQRHEERIAGEVGVAYSTAREALRALHELGIVVRLHHVGHRSPGQLGWTTNTFLAPELLRVVGLLPMSSRRRALAALRARRGAIASSLEGHARDELEALLGPPSAPPGGTPQADNCRPAGTMGPKESSSVAVTRTGSEHYPLPPRVVDGVDNRDRYSSSEGAVAPLPLVASAGVTAPSSPRDGSDDQPAPPGKAARHVGGAFLALPLRARVAHCQGDGRYRSTGQATDAAVGIGRMQKRRELERAAGRPPGRDREAARARRELRRMRLERQRAGEPTDTGGDDGARS